jgi:hypothetical protein
MDIVGHVSRQMLARYLHIRMNAKGRACKEACTSKPCPPSAFNGFRDVMNSVIRNCLTYSPGIAGGAATPSRRYRAARAR